MGTLTWLNVFLNNLFLKAVPQFLGSYIIIELNKNFNDLYLISVKFLGYKILGDKVVDLGGECSMGKNALGPKPCKHG